MDSNFIKNENLETIKKGWKGNSVDGKDNFLNLEHPFMPNLGDVLKWKLSENPQKKEKEHDQFKVPVLTKTDFINSGQDCIVWLGHATFFIRTNGINILTDPVFFDIPFVKRLSSWPIDSSIFKNINYILLSHDHRDHCQKRSLKILSENNPEVKILTGLRMESLLKPWLNGNQIQEAGWYQKYNNTNNLEIFFLPTRHWSKRGAFDNNSRLWGAFLIKAGDKKIYFGGDSGYGNHFAEVKDLFSVPDVCILGIGAYKPKWFMNPNHISPDDAVKAFNEMDGKVMIPMHYGTFDLSDEPPGEPLKVLEELSEKGEIKGELRVLVIGEEYLL